MGKAGCAPLSRPTSSTNNAVKSEGFQQRLRALRKQKNLSQADLAATVGIHTSHVGRYERGVSRPTADTLKRLAGALGVSGDYLMEGSTEEAAKANFEDRELLQQFQEIERLPEGDQTVVKIFLDAFITKQHIKALAR